MGAHEPPEDFVYTHNTEYPAWRIAKDIISIVVFPIGICRVIHSVAAKFGILPASISLAYRGESHPTHLRSSIQLNKELKMKRLSVKVDGYTIDAAIMGKASTLGNGRWVVYSNGNGELYEHNLHRCSFEQILTELNGNAIVFNYPGVAGSKGMPNRAAMAKAYRAILNLIEDQESGIGAREIIGFGHSLGGAVQGEALRSHQLKQNIKYCFVKSRTFSDLSSTATNITGLKIFGFLVRFFCWNMSSIKSSMNPDIPEIIMQTAGVYEPTDIGRQPDLVVDDDVIGADVSLVKKLLESGLQPSSNKYFMGIPEHHNDPLEDLSRAHLVNQINHMLAL